MEYTGRSRARRLTVVIKEDGIIQETKYYPTQQDFNNGYWEWIGGAKYYIPLNISSMSENDYNDYIEQLILYVVENENVTAEDIDVPFINENDESCPLPDTPTEEGWDKILEFDTDIPSDKPLNAYIATSDGSGSYKWKIGNYEKSGNTLYYYTDGLPKTVELYAQQSITGIGSIELQNINIVGEVDLSHDVFKKLTTIRINRNPDLDSLIFPSSLDSKIKRVLIHHTGLTSLDISMISKIEDFSYTASEITINNNPDLDNIIFPSSLTGKLQTLNLSYNNLISLDLTGFNTFNNFAKIDIGRNPLLESVIFSSSISGIFKNVRCDQTRLTSLDLSGISKFVPKNNNGEAEANILLYNNYYLNSVTFSNTITGDINQIGLDTCNLTNTLDLSMFKSLRYITINSNPNLENVIFTNSAISETSFLNIGGTVIENLDLSGLIFTIDSTILINGSQGSPLEDVILSNNGSIQRLEITNNTNLNFVDFSITSIYPAYSSWKLKNNNWTEAIINNILVDINNNATAPSYTSCSIDISGNSYPTGAGETAMNNLISKNITIIT